MRRTARFSRTTFPGYRRPACRSVPCATYVGSSALLALAGPMGGAGAILALANVEPARCRRAFTGDAAAQRELADRHLAVRAGGPAALKAILAASRGTSAAVRVPAA